MRIYEREEENSATRMAEEIQEEEGWEERTLSLIDESKIIDQQLSGGKSQKKAGKKHKLRKMGRPMAIPQVILELQEEDLREDALRCLSNFLLEKREVDQENYYRTGYLLFNSCGTLAILLQEVLESFGKMVDGSLNVRSAKRLANVLTLFQSIAANSKTRQKFVDTQIPNFLIPIITFESPLEVFQNVQAVALSVIGILCQAREASIIKWAIESNLVETCQNGMENGNELSKVIGMHILEAILRDESGLSYICDPVHCQLFTGLMKSWEHLVDLLAVDQDFSPRLLFHIIRCYVLLCDDLRGYNVVMSSLPDAITDGSFHEITEEFPVIGSLLHQLLLSLGKATEV